MVLIIFLIIWKKNLTVYYSWQKTVTFFSAFHSTDTHTESAALILV